MEVTQAELGLRPIDPVVAVYWEDADEQHCRLFIDGYDVHIERGADGKPAIKGGAIMVLPDSREFKDFHKAAALTAAKTIMESQALREKYQTRKMVTPEMLAELRRSIDGKRKRA